MLKMSVVNFVWLFLTPFIKATDFILLLSFTFMQVFVYFLQDKKILSKQKKPNRRCETWRGIALCDRSFDGRSRLLHWRWFERTRGDETRRGWSLRDSTETNGSRFPRSPGADHCGDWRFRPWRRSRTGHVRMSPHCCRSGPGSNLAGRMTFSSIFDLRWAWPKQNWQLFPVLAELRTFLGLLVWPKQRWVSRISS